MYSMKRIRHELSDKIKSKYFDTNYDKLDYKFINNNIPENIYVEIVDKIDDTSMELDKEIYNSN